jgi:hypothetical protein
VFRPRRSSTPVRLLGALGYPSALARTPRAVSEPTTTPTTATGPAHLTFEDVRMAFGERQVFDGLSFRFPPARISVIMGGS